MSMTYYEWSCKSSGYAIRLYKQWEHTRYIAWWFIRMNASNPPKSPEDIMPLPIDPEKIVSVATTVEDKQKMFEQGQERLKKFVKLP